MEELYHQILVSKATVSLVKIRDFYLESFIFSVIGSSVSGRVLSVSLDLYVT